VSDEQSDSGEYDEIDDELADLPDFVPVPVSTGPPSYSARPIAPSSAVSTGPPSSPPHPTTSSATVATGPPTVASQMAPTPIMEISSSVGEERLDSAIGGSPEATPSRRKRGHELPLSAKCRRTDTPSEASNASSRLSSLAASVDLALSTPTVGDAPKSFVTSVMSLRVWEEIEAAVEQEAGPEGGDLIWFYQVWKGKGKANLTQQVESEGGKPDEDRPFHSSSLDTIKRKYNKRGLYIKVFLNNPGQEPEQIRVALILNPVSLLLCALGILHVERKL